MKRDTTPAAEALQSSDTLWRKGAIVFGDRFPSPSVGACFHLLFPAGIFSLSAMILFVAATAAIACWWRSMRVPVGEILPPAALVGALLVAARYYRARGENAFVLCLTTLAQIVAFAASYIALMYTLATLALPLADVRLAAFDARRGLQVPLLREWAVAHPPVAMLLGVAYDTLLYQTALVVAVLGLKNDRRRLTGFVWMFVLSALIALGLFIVLPAAGPFVMYDFALSPDQAIFLEHFESLRDGSRTVVSFRGAEGLITFPSFHVAWAILLTWAFRGRRLLFAAAAIVNLLVIVSTMTTGWHYFADVLGGAAVALTAIGLTFRLRRHDE
jgi:membrane-associated phospholipid phosphatase